MIGKFGTVITTSTGGGGTYSTVLHEYTTSGTWTKPAGLLFIEIACIGGGGGGGSGGRQATGVVSRAGSGAGSGGITLRTLLASQLGATESYTIGAGGAGGAARTVDNSTSAQGGVGGATTFGTLAQANGGAVGNLGGNVGAQRSGTGFSDVVNRWIVTANSDSRSDGGAGQSPTSESTGNAVWLNAFTSGSGGGVTTANVGSNGGSGSRYFNTSGALNTAASAGVASGGAGGAGVDNYVDRSYSKTMLDAGASKFLGTGGGGGAGHATGVGGAGGTGGLYGGPGGGGGSSRNGFNSGKGGDGAGGLIVILEHIVS